MTQRENYLSVLRRTGGAYAPTEMNLCPYLQQNYGARLQKFREENGIAPQTAVNSESFLTVPQSQDVFLPYYRQHPLKPGAEIDGFGVAHEPGSAAARHMTYMRHPLEELQTLAQLERYPFPRVLDDPAHLQRVKAENQRLKQQDKIVVGNMQCTVWEKAWYLRGMEQLMMDMLCDEDCAAFVLDKITQYSVLQAQFFARAGCDVLFLGDDVGMQKSIMMSLPLYEQWLKPRLAKVIAAAKAISRDILIFYHSCGFVTPFIPHLLEAGVEVLNPVQPECMDFAQIHEAYGDRLSFHGTIGTQSVMPFGTPQQVRDTVMQNLRLAGKRGGLLACPTHLLEPEVPPENIEAYLLACRDFTY